MTERKIIKAKETIPLSNEFFEETQRTLIVWLGGAGFLINSRGTIILIDPVLTTIQDQDLISETGLKMYVHYPMQAADIPKADAVLYTHTDNDHLGQRTAPILARLNPKMIGPHPVFRQLTLLGIDPGQIETCRTGDRIRVGDILIEITPADHPWQLLDPTQYGAPFRREDCCGYIVTTPDGRCYFPGDTRLMEEHLNIQNIDFLALDVSQDLYHLGVQGAIVLANAMPKAKLIPMHYGTYDAPDIDAHYGDPEVILSQVVDSGERTRTLQPGEIYTLES